MKISQVNEILNKYNVSAKKMYGQNFLMDDSVIDKIIESSNIDDTTGVIEIGPGLGFLTKALCAASKQVLCYEIDDDMVAVLEKELANFNNVKVLLKDFLKANVEEDISTYLNHCERIILVSNLPYYITTPILLKVFEETTSIKSLTCMVQKEVADRLCGKPSTKDYNCLSVLVQYYTKAENVINVPRASFYPEPDVDSAVVKLTYICESRITAKNEPYFKKFNRVIFNQRRKTLSNNLKSGFGYNKELIDDVLNKNNISLTIRSEALTVSQIVKLADDFYEAKK